MAPSGHSSRVRTATSSTSASLMVRGTPGRGSSPSPSSRLARKRARHLITVPRLTPSRADTAVLLRPSAQASTIRARSASPCAVLRRFAQFSRVRRSAPDSTSGSSLLSPITPADRGPRAPSPPSRELKRNTTHVATTILRTRTLAHGQHHRSPGTNTPTGATSIDSGRSGELACPSTDGRTTLAGSRPPVKAPYWRSPAGSGRTATAGRTARPASGSGRRQRCRPPTRSARRAQLAAT